MLFIICFVLGLATPAIASQFLWLPLVIACQQPKQGLVGLLCGLTIITISFKSVIKDGIYTLPVQQKTHLRRNTAVLEVLENKQGFSKGDLITTRLSQDFYLKNTSCTLKCKPASQNNKWYNLANNIVGKCQAIQCSKPKTQNTAKIALENQIPSDLKNIGVIKALLLGQAYLVPKEQKQLFKFAGLAHLIAVSGLHIGLLASIVGHILGLLWRMLLRITWQIPRLTFISIGNCIGAITYTWLSGFGDASIRAMTMIIVAKTLKHLPIHFSNEQILLTAIFCILACKPLSVFSLGLWLSAVAVWALINAGSSIIKSQVYIFIVMLPIQAMMAWPIGWWMPVVNLVTIPIFSVVLIPAVFVSWIFSLGPLWNLCDKALTYFFKLLALLQEHVGYGYIIPINSDWQLLFLVLMAFYCIRSQICKPVILAGLFLFEQQSTIMHGNFRAEVLDVGQGLAVVIRTRNHNILVDTATESMAQKTLLPMLQKNGIKYLDTIVVSHGDKDHSGGLDTVIKRINYGQIIAGEPERLEVKSSACKNHSWIWDGVVFSSFQVHANSKHNNLSCIIHVQAANKSILLPGDIETSAEKALLQTTMAGSMRADILVAPHHGSISSSSHGFISAVNPKTIVISAGDYAIYKHPAKANVKYWRQLQIKILNTHMSGSISL